MVIGARSENMVVNVLLAFNNMLFSEGVKTLLEDDKNIKVVGILNSGDVCDEEFFKALSPDVALVDFTTLYNHFPDESLVKENKFVLIDTDCGRENIVSSVLTKQLNGVLLGNSSGALLRKAVKAVAAGEVWIDKATVKNVLLGVNALKKNDTAQLSDKEREVVQLVSQGFTNKEIAKKVHISEPTVKTHLYRIFRKLNIKNRAQLVTYAIKNHEA